MRPNLFNQGFQVKRKGTLLCTLHIYCVTLLCLQSLLLLLKTNLSVLRTCISGQYEHFRNHESVFKEYRPYFEHEANNASAVAGQVKKGFHNILKNSKRCSFFSDGGFKVWRAKPRGQIRKLNKIYSRKITMCVSIVRYVSRELCSVGTFPPPAIGIRLRRPLVNQRGD